MTREERLAAGWKECWGCYDDKDGTWMTNDSTWSTGKPAYQSNPKSRKSYSRKEAHVEAGTCSVAFEVRARRFWRRKTKTLGRIAVEAWTEFYNDAPSTEVHHEAWQFVADRIAAEVRRRDAK